MKYARLMCVTVGLLFSFNGAYGYELGTHGRITHRAYLNSILTFDEALFNDLGLQERLADDAFGVAYYDFTSTRTEVRFADPFESSQNRMPSEVKPLSIPGWLLRGAIRGMSRSDHARCR